MKNSIVTPILKKASLDSNVLKHYRPVSNLDFVSKLIEKQAVKALVNHTEKHNLGEKLQSAYKSAHSTETALMRVKDDIMKHIANHRGVFLVLLDLSSAFDTVNHNILINRLETELGIKGKVLNWFRSYLSNRTSRVSINGILSEPTELKYGVPQGSIVGPTAFSLYVLPLGNIIRKFELSFHMYADDVQLYTHFEPKDPALIAAALDKISSCIDTIKLWMKKNMLKLNDDKSEFFVTTTAYLKNNFSSVYYFHKIHKKIT